MTRALVRTIAFRGFAMVVVLGAARYAHAQGDTARYPSRAPVDQYLMADRNAEIALARSAAPESISRDADVMVLGRHGYETAVKGTNGFVCVVERSWTTDRGDPEFWNPKLRGPICFNPPAARTYLPITIKKTEWILAGGSEAQMFDSVNVAFDTKALPALEPGAMSYMMSAHGYLNDHDGHWHPHLMFFVPQTDAASWGADRPGSPILATPDVPDRLTVFLVPLGKWSDGTVAPAYQH